MAEVFYLYKFVIMKNETILLKVKLRLNKIASNDNINLDSWSILEAFNKFQVEWCRRNAHGENTLREGDEQSVSRIDDLQIILVDPLKLSFVDKGIYYQSNILEWPKDYMRYKGIDLTVTNECCNKPKRMIVYLGDESDVDVYLDDPNIRPNYSWGETFVTITGNKLNLYHNNKFNIHECALRYYRQPKRIEMIGVVDSYSGLIPGSQVLCEFNDDLVELLIDGAAEILAGDIENMFQKQRLESNEEKNN